MSDTPAFEDLMNRLRALLDAEYRRGQADAVRRIIEVAQEEVRPSSAPEKNPELASTNGAEHPAEHLSVPKRRAPAGAPDALVTRVLMERGSRGASSTEIEEAAVSDIERMVSQSGIRFALDRGRSAGKYRNQYGRWYMTEEAKN
jgi:hypothetical protein